MALGWAPAGSSDLSSRRNYKNSVLVPETMLKFLKALFGMNNTPAQPQGSAMVPLDELENWLANAQAPALAKLAEQLTLCRQRTAELCSTVREKAAALQNAQLMNPDIPERAKDFMQGNREEYCRRVLQYTDTLAVPDTAASLQSFLAQHQQDAQEFTQGILRPFQILQEFFAHESKEITALLAQAEQELLALKAAHDQTCPELHASVREAMNALAAKKHQRIELQTELAIQEKQRTEADQSIRALNTEEERLLKDSARQTALQKVSETHRNIIAHEQKIKDVFANFEPGLRKFHRMATRQVKLAERYLRDPIKALAEDLHLDILEIIEDMRRLIKFDRLPVGDKKQHFLDAMQLLTREFLGTWLREYGKLTKAEKDAQQAVEDCEASKKLARVQRLRDDARRSMQLAEQRLAAAKKDLEKNNLDELRTQLEKQVSGIAKSQVTIAL
jgi:hypothetical protein